MRMCESVQCTQDIRVSGAAVKIPERTRLAAHRRVLVTGCAGFLGSHLTERLLAQTTKVLGIDAFTDYYAKDLKKANLARFIDHPRFEFRRVDLSRDALEGLLTGVEAVYHLAGQPGVRW